jgi:hypothetical protein
MASGQATEGPRVGGADTREERLSLRAWEG